MSTEGEKYQNELELIKSLCRKSTAGEAKQLQDDELLRYVYFSDRSALDEIAKSLAVSPVLAQRFVALSDESESISSHPLSDSADSVSESVIGFIAGAIEEAAVKAIAAKEMSSCQWRSEDSTGAEVGDIKSSAINLIAHSVRSSMNSEMYVGGKRSTQTMSRPKSTNFLPVIDPYASVDPNGRLRYEALIDVDIVDGLRIDDTLALYFIDPCGGYLLLGEARYANPVWGIEVERFGEAMGIRDSELPARYFAIGFANQEPESDAWKAYVYTSDSQLGMSETPTAEFVLASQPSIEDGILTLEVDLPEGFVQVFAGRTISLHMRLGWRHQSLAEWPVSGITEKRHSFRASFPYLDNQAIPFGSMFFFEIV